MTSQRQRTRYEIPSKVVCSYSAIAHQQQSMHIILILTSKPLNIEVPDQLNQEQKSWTLYKSYVSVKQPKPSNFSAQNHIEKHMTLLPLQSKDDPLQLIQLKQIKFPMQKSFLYHFNQQPLFLCPYYPMYTCVPPFSYAQSSLTSSFNSNFNFHDQKAELNTNPCIQTQTLNQSKKMMKNAVITAIKRNKQRHHRNKSKLIQSAKKNCESNIINHTLTFLTKQMANESLLDRAIAKLGKSYEQRIKIRQHFQEVLKLVNLKRERKYINKKNVLCFFTSESLRKQLPILQQNSQKSNFINLDQLCYLYRICIVYYLRNLSPMGILTSKRIEGMAKKIHLKRRRFILSVFLKEERSDQSLAQEE